MLTQGIEMKNDPFSMFGIFVFAVIIVLGIGILLAYPFMLVWNMCLVPAITVLKPITFWQGFFIWIFMTSCIRGYNTGSKS